VRLDAGSPKGLEQGRDPRAHLAVGFAELQTRNLPGMDDMPRRAERRRDIGGAGNGAACAEDRIKRLGAFNAVLEGEDIRARFDRRRQCARRRLRIGQLHAKQRRVGPRRIDRIGDAPRWVDAEVAQEALDKKPLATDRLAMRAAGDKSHVGAAGGELGAEITSDAAGSHDDRPHPVAPSTLRSPLCRRGRRPPVAKIKSYCAETERDLSSFLDNHPGGLRLY
jgi:hypothetical protein